MGSRGARRETAAQLRVELLAARASLVRAAAAGAQAPELAALIAATEAGPVRVEVDTASWFAREPDEIPEGESP